MKFKVETAVFILILLLFLFIITKPNEHFDTYWNHTIYAQDVYSKSANQEQKDASNRLDDTELLAKYTWNNKSRDGMQLYDHVYEAALVHDDNYSQFATFEENQVPDQNKLFTVVNGEYITLNQKQN